MDDWLTFGLAADGLLVHGDEIPPAGASLGCPYCDAPLTPRRGGLHHAEPACAAVTRPLRHLPLVPLTGRFDADLAPAERAALSTLVHSGRVSKNHQRLFEYRQLIQWNRYAGYRGAWELTKPGAAILGELSMMLFCELQDARLWAPLRGCIQAAEWAARTHWDAAGLRTALMDLRLYRAALRRRLMLSFALLELHLDGRTVYHSAVSYRPVAELAAELHEHLAEHHRQVTVTVLDAWPHRGTIERYFAHRYQRCRTSVATLDDCFRFPDPAAVLRDLRRMPPKELGAAETQLILFDDPPAIEGAILAHLATHAATEQRGALRALIQAGMQRAKDQGTPWRMTHRCSPRDHRAKARS